MKNLFVIIVTFRRFEHFRRTIESLLPTLPEGSVVRVIYNTEGRHPDDEKYDAYFKELFARTDIVHVLNTGANGGWGASMNEGLALYQFNDYEYVLESNNDVKYEPDWFGKARALMEGNGELGILGLWSHPHHGVRERRGDLVVKDNMPATAWFFRAKDLQAFLPFRENGACKTRGGNGEDTDMVIKVQGMGRWVGGPSADLAHHMDGYDSEDLGKPNAAYVS